MTAVLRSTTIVAGLVLTFAASWAREPAPAIAKTSFYDDFLGDTVDPDKWLVAQRQWGGPGVNGGVTPKNVSVNDNSLILTALGKFYRGPILGINKHGIPRSHGQRVGAAIATRQYFGSGRYEVRARVAPRFGVCSAFSSMHYREFHAGDPEYVPNEGVFNKPYIINHEIDIEIPGRPNKLAFDDVSFDHGLFNTWCGQREDQFNDTYLKIGQYQDDGEFHVYRYDWHTGSKLDGSDSKVDFYVDDKHVYTSTRNVPNAAARFWVQLWFPDRWAGEPYFDETQMEVDWVRITPFNEKNDKAIAESFPNDGWAGAESPLQAIVREKRDSTATRDGGLLVADFEQPDGSHPLGGAYRSFARYPAEASVRVTSAGSAGDGRSLQLDFNVPEGNWSGFWVRFGEESRYIDARRYSFVSLRIRGERGGEELQFGISDRSWVAKGDSLRVGHVRDFLPEGVTTNWATLFLPVTSDTRLDPRELHGISFICEEGEGTVYIDDIMLE